MTLNFVENKEKDFERILVLCFICKEKKSQENVTKTVPLYLDATFLSLLLQIQADGNHPKNPKSISAV